MTRRLLPAILLFCLCLLLPFGAAAEETDRNETPEIPENVWESYTELLNLLPDTVRKSLPDGLALAENFPDAVTGLSDAGTLLSALLSIVGADFPALLSLTATVCGLLLLSAVVRAFRELLGAGVGKAFTFLTALTVLSVLLVKGYDTVQDVTGYFDTLTAMTGASVPLLGALYAIGGNVSTAAASAAGLTACLNLTGAVIGKSIVPFCGICLAFALIAALDPGLRTGALISTVKKNYTTLIAFLVMFLLAMLSAQTTLAAKSDTLAMKSAKFAAGSLLPTVGGSVSELLRTVSAGVGYLRGIFGICATFLLLLTLFPTLIRLLLYRLAWQICASVADLLGCESEKKLLDEFASLSGYLMTAVAISSSVLLLAFSLVTHCAAATG